MARILEASNQVSIMERVGRDVFNIVRNQDCTYRVEVRTSDGAIRHYGLRADSKPDARVEAKLLIGSLLNGEDDRILWRMAGEKNWSLNGAAAPKGQKKASLFKRTMNYFFELED